MKLELLKRLINLTNNDGFTMKKFNQIRYKTGWQVATAGVETTNILRALIEILKTNGNCGVWLSDGIYYIDSCKRINTKKEAIEIGRTCNQISIYGWKKGNLAYC